MMQRLSLQVHHIENATDTTRCIYFTPLSSFSYRAGQYITLVLHINGQEVRRPYSLSSTPGIDPMPFITVKRIENGEASRFLHMHLTEGDRVACLPPNGRFTLPEYLDSTPLVFIAAGSGISPIFSLLKQALLKSNSDVLLIYSNTSSTNTIFLQQIEELKTTYTHRFKVVYFFSDAKNLAKARLNRFNLEELLLTQKQPLTQSLFYMCAPFVYMEMVEITLLTLGVHKTQLLKETYFNPEETDEEEEDGSLIGDKALPDFTDNETTVLLNHITYRFPVKAGQTILYAALKHQVPLPYSCSKGMCSTCVCQVTEGKVYQGYNQVLTDKEMAEGRILSCTAIPTTPETRITFDH